VGFELFHFRASIAPYAQVGTNPFEKCPTGFSTEPSPADFHRRVHRFKKEPPRWVLHDARGWHNRSGSTSPLPFKTCVAHGQLLLGQLTVQRLSKSLAQLSRNVEPRFSIRDRETDRMPIGGFPDVAFRRSCRRPPGPSRAGPAAGVFRPGAWLPFVVERLTHSLAAPTAPPRRVTLAPRLSSARALRPPYKHPGQNLGPLSLRDGPTESLDFPCTSTGACDQPCASSPRH